MRRCDNANNLLRASTDNGVSGMLRTMGRNSEHDSVHILHTVKGRRSAYYGKQGDHFHMQLIDPSIEFAIASGRFNTDYTSQQAGSR